MSNISDAVEVGSQQFINSIRILGAVTVAFFILLGLLIYQQLFFNESVKISHAHSETQSNVLEGKIDLLSRSAEIQIYVQRQTCRNTAKTELQRIACDKSPAENLGESSALDTPI